MCINQKGVSEFDGTGLDYIELNIKIVAGTHPWVSQPVGFWLGTCRWIVERLRGQETMVQVFVRRDGPLDHSGGRYRKC